MRPSMRSIVGAGLACGLALLMANGTYSQAQEERTTTTVQVRRVSTVIGAAVQLQAGGDFGRVEDIVINEDGCIDFVVVVFEEKLIAVPFSITRLDFARRVVALNVQREVLVKAPTFARNQFPDLSVNSDFSRRITTHFKAQGRERPRDSRPAEKKPAEKKSAEKEKKPAEKKPAEKEKKPAEKESS